MNKRRGKNGQIFIFAAVIISVIVLSMAAITNYAKVKNEPTNFYDYNYQIRHESNEVLDYSVYSGFNDGANISNFVRLMADDIRDKDSNANFLFIYGDNSTLYIDNYGSDVAGISGGNQNVVVNGGALKILSSVSIGGSSSYVGTDYTSLGGTGSRAVLNDVNKVNVTILKNSFVFNIEKDKQVIFIMQKEDGGELYVST